MRRDFTSLGSRMCSTRITAGRDHWSEAGNCPESSVSIKEAGGPAHTLLPPGQLAGITDVKIELLTPAQQRR